MITIRIADNFIPERTYSIDVLFSEFLGLDYKIMVDNAARDYEIILENGNTLLVRDIFFGKFKDGLDYLDEDQIPLKTPHFENPFTAASDIPAIFGTDELVIRQGKIVCGIDIFASSFFMLTRWEECANKSRDSHDRFPAHESLAHKRRFLHRAVVNEYVEMLWNMLSHLKCGQARKERAFRIFATHDVDAPFLHAMKSPLAAVRQMGGDLIRRKDPRAALDNFNSWSKIAGGDAKRDPYNTFGFIMDLSEQFGLQSTFLFMADRRQPEYDGNYSIGHRSLRRLMADMHGRGHDIGLHASYGSFDDRKQTKKELDILKAVCFEEGIGQRQWMSRQHFLRWETPTTFNNLETAGINYDSTLSYADAAGFRCGVCYDYPAFNILERARLNLRERPLLVMECTIIDERYMGLGAGEAAFSFIKSIKDTCRRFKGDFVILWHNTRLVASPERRLYSRILRA
ncbi:MAG: polysaccharide deacetylase family protein [Nitrospiraceae bacterium]|nr:polysaccharide deacetylase family protein [Nitrospiraceae bacterium]